ncbi:hypothetical protein F4009_05455 [Candidatus Poribacteria bacterium]|nr:hypothetical protein [Candidatus Poribacteria bacterium]MYH83471.1 hypothetical protein [Candidatus Poribacteria bacterium]MYK93433.1 hypothetical protein [Candidatus Poribacteria bacterium]
MKNTKVATLHFSPLPPANTALPPLQFLLVQRPSKRRSAHFLKIRHALHLSQFSQPVAAFRSLRR